MKRIIALLSTLIFSTAQAPAPSQTPGNATLPAIRHFVYRFGYNTKAADSGNGTGTTTIDITGVAPDGGLLVNATDDWWNAVNPKQTASCEIHLNGNVECPNPPYNLTGIQVTVIPLLANRFFSGFGSNPNNTVDRKYTVRASFLPGANSGFLGQVYTWNCSFSVSGAGKIPESPSLVLIHSKGQMAQQGGLNIKANGEYNIAYDPSINMPVVVNSQWTFVPRMTVSYYTVEMRLIHVGP